MSSACPRLPPLGLSRAPVQPQQTPSWQAGPAPPPRFGHPHPAPPCAGQGPGGMPQFGVLSGACGVRVPGWQRRGRLGERGSCGLGPPTRSLLQSERAARGGHEHCSGDTSHSLPSAPRAAQPGVPGGRGGERATGGPQGPRLSSKAKGNMQLPACSPSPHGTRVLETQTEGGEHSGPADESSGQGRRGRGAVPLTSLDASAEPLRGRCSRGVVSELTGCLEGWGGHRVPPMAVRPRR